MSSYSSLHPPKHKVVLLGESGVGKSSLVHRFVKGYFKDFYEATIGAAYMTQSMKVENETIVLEIWDTAGQERYNSLLPMYYRGASAALVVYDLTNQASYKRALQWVRELQPATPRREDPGMVIVLTGNKLDLSDARAIATDEAQQFACENGVLFMETSAKDATNVQDTFIELGKRILSNRQALLTSDALRVGDQSSGKATSCCSSSFSFD